MKGVVLFDVLHRSGVVNSDPDPLAVWQGDDLLLRLELPREEDQSRLVTLQGHLHEDWIVSARSLFDFTGSRDG
jgi:hypothetical protein